MRFRSSSLVLRSQRVATCFVTSKSQVDLEEGATSRLCGKKFRISNAFRVSDLEVEYVL